MARRGMMTTEIKAKAKELLGIEDFGTQELRLMPYLTHCLMNEGSFGADKIAPEERPIIQSWREKGWMAGGISSKSLEVTKEFWDSMSEILWLAYVTCTD